MRGLKAWIISLLLAWCLPTAVWAHDFILERANWTDTAATATFEQARQQTYTPFDGVLSKGFGSQAQWVRLKIGAVDPQGPATLVLRIRPVFLDEVTLYDPVELARGKPPMVAGDHTEWAATDFESLHHTFTIAAQPQPREIWLRLVTTSTQMMYVEALSPKEFQRTEHSLWLGYDLLLALLVSFLLWVLMAWLRDHDPVNGLFVIRQAVFLAYTAVFLGYHRIVFDGVLSPVNQNHLYSWVVFMGTATSLAFEFRFLGEYEIPKWGRYILRSLLLCSVAVMVLMVFGHEAVALRSNMQLTGAIFLLLPTIALSIKGASTHPSTERYLLPKAAIVAYYLMLLVFFAMALLSNLGVVQGNNMSIYGVLLYGLYSGAFVSGLLIMRSRQRERLQQEIANQFQISRKQLEVETRYRQDQSQLLSMLMHELKTPLAIIDMAFRVHPGQVKTEGYIDRAIENMKSILNRCIQTDRLVDRPFAPQKNHFDVAVQLHQWLEDMPSAKGRCHISGLASAELVTDMQCVQIILTNLIENAVKYGANTSPIDVQLDDCKQTDGRNGWRVRVCNQPGQTGRPDADLVFTKYYRSASAQRVSGTGLGLYLSHNLAQLIGAQLRYCPDEQRVCFELWLPT